MYQLWIPVYNRQWNRKQKEQLADQLSRLKPQMVLLTYARVMVDPAKKQKEYETFMSNKSFLEEKGFRVGAWLCPTIGYGAAYTFDNGPPFTKLKTLKDDEDRFPGAYCPLDDDFVAEFLSILKNVVSTGVSTILFEDDYTLSGGKGGFDRLSCCCDRHMARYCQMIGEDLTIAELRDRVYFRGGNRYRSTWLQLMGQTLKDFTAKIEKYVHDINPEIRIGLSANSASFNIEGVGIDELARIAAGKTRPLIRLTGAPYWKNLPTFATNIEAVRLQSAWCGKDIELITEGDTFPRPRHWIPSAELEAFDSILRAERSTEGILKYMLDYNSSPDYETGYIDRHLRNETLYAEIEKRFHSGQVEGLRVFENQFDFSDISFGDDHPFEQYGSTGYIPLATQWMLCDNSIPTVYGDSDGAALVFGENAKHVTEEMLGRGMVLDAPAAKILIQKGVDIGIERMEPVASPVAEGFPDYEACTIVGFERKGSFYRYQLKDGAKELSRFYLGGDGLGVIPPEGVDEQNGFTACLLYENGNGQRFMVYSFAIESVTVYSNWKHGLFRNYCRQKQIADGVKWLQKKPLPAMCFGNPNLYILCKRDGKKLTVGLWNIFADEVMTPVIHLDRKYAEIDCYRCNAHIEEDKVKFTTDIPPYSLAFFTVRESEA